MKYIFPFILCAILVGVIFIFSSQDICKSNEYLVDYACVRHSECREGFYIRQPGTKNSDNLCEPITVCQSGYWAQTPATSTSDAQCVPHTMCSAGQYVAQEGTPTSDVVCANCPPNHWIEDNTLGIDACIPHMVCSENTWAFITGTSSSDTECTPHTESCPSGFFMETKGTSIADVNCRRHTTCPDGTWLRTPGTENMDNECVPLQECTEQNGFDPNYQCADNPIIDANGNRTNDRSCACMRKNSDTNTRGMWRPGNICNTTPCATHTACGPNRYLIREGDQTRDNFCEYLTSCGTNKLRQGDCNSSLSPHVINTNEFGDRLENNKCKCAPGLSRVGGVNTCESDSVDCHCDSCMNDMNLDNFGWVYDQSNDRYGCGYATDIVGQPITGFQNQRCIRAPTWNDSNQTGTLSTNWISSYGVSREQTNNFNQSFYASKMCLASDTNMLPENPGSSVDPCE